MYDRKPLNRPNMIQNTAIGVTIAVWSHERKNGLGDLKKPLLPRVKTTANQMQKSMIVTKPKALPFSFGSDDDGGIPLI